MNEHIDEKQMVHAIDTETTGVDFTIDRVRSIGLVSGTLAGGVTARHSVLIDTAGVASSPQALAIHRIPDSLEGGISLATAMEEVAAIIGTDPVIAQNGVFDYTMLRANLGSDGQTIPDFLRRPVIDTMEMAAKRFPGKRVNLDQLTRMTGVADRIASQRSKRHDATEDAFLTFEVWRALSTRQTLFGESDPDNRSETQTETSPTRDKRRAIPETISWL